MKLNEDILIRVFGYLGYLDLLRVEICCKDWKHYVLDDMLKFQLNHFYESLAAKQEEVNIPAEFSLMVQVKLVQLSKNILFLMCQITGEKTST